MVEKKSEPLQALARDYNQLLKDVAEIEAQARRLWDSEIDLAGMHPQLSNHERKWMESITKMVGDAKNCVTIFKQLSQELYLTACFRVVHIVDFVLQIKRTKRAIAGSKLVQNQMLIIRDIYESMERSRSKNKSMLHVLYSFKEKDSIPALEPVQMKSSTSIIELIKRSKDFFCGMEEVIWSIYSLLLLHVFLMDVSQLKLETETQMVWVKQANGLIAEAEESIDTFTRLVLTFGNNMILRNKFRRDMKRISTAVDDLLNKKGELYHFELMDRASEKSINFSIYMDTGVREIISAMKSTVSDLAGKELDGERIYEINSMFNSLENMYNKIYAREEATFRSVCLEQIKCIAQELDSFLEQIKSKREARIKCFKKLKQIEQAITLLQKITDVCCIERQCSSSVVDLGTDIQELVSQLITEGDKHLVISIVGMRGVG